ncbi:YceI family protein [Phaeodactylibacter luteus]|uniref:YceI family protein n=1 Tax=Phaeodactylibacter luteus TaxID=1564516 RepID=A0A5C6RRV2_9BACT|nr:YceI family protein [Phaeodactylibacter luteus]TXB64897.1 YceI family protein [Phaeodactylibacter luteus]
MKKVSIFTMMLAAMATLSMSFTNPSNNGQPERRSVSVSESTIVWNGYKVTGSHTGNIQLKSGELEYDGKGMLTGGSFEIDMTTITCNDLQGEYNQKLVGHLKSDDFFGVANHPTATFEITQVVHRGTPGDYKIVGDLTIKGIKKEIKFMANVKEDGNNNVATAEVVVDRSEYNVRYGSGSFFDNLGDKTIYDEFDLQVTLVTAK